MNGARRPETPGPKTARLRWHPDTLLANGTSVHPGPRSWAREARAFAPPSTEKPMDTACYCARRERRRCTSGQVGVIPRRSSLARRGHAATEVRTVLVWAVRPEYASRFSAVSLAIGLGRRRARRHTHAGMATCDLLHTVHERRSSSVHARMRQRSIVHCSNHQ